MKKRTIVSMLCLMLVFFTSVPHVYAQDNDVLFTSTIKEDMSSKFTATVTPDTSTVTTKKGTYDSYRGTPFEIAVPAGTNYCAVSKMDSVSTDNAPIVAADLTVLLQDTNGKKEIYLNTKDAQSQSQVVSLMTINGNALMVGDTSVSNDYFKFGTWAGGHYHLRLYYFAKLGKIGVNIQKLKYDTGTPVDKEWTFTAPALKSSVIDSIGLRIDCTSSSNSTIQIFKTFDLIKLSESDVPESTINSQRRYDFNDLDTKSIKDQNKSGFHTSYYGWYIQNTSNTCDVEHADVDGKKVLKLFTDGTKYLDLLKYFDLSLTSEAIIEADVKLEQGSVIDLTIRGPQCSDNTVAGKSLIHFEDGKAKLLSSMEISGFEYGKWFRVSVYIDDTGATPYAKAKLVNLDTGAITEAVAQFDFINTIKYINTFKITPAYGKVSTIYVDNISFSEKNAHRINPDFEAGSTVSSDEVSFTSPTFNIDKSKSSVKLNGMDLELASISTDEFNKVKIKGLKQNAAYTMNYKFCNYWGDEADGTISFSTGTLYDLTSPVIAQDGSKYTVSTNGNIVTSSGNKAKLVIAAYDKATNELLLIDIATIDEASQKADYSSTFTLTQDAADCNVKAFLWTADNEPIATE